MRKFTLAAATVAMLLSAPAVAQNQVSLGKDAVMASFAKLFDHQPAARQHATAPFKAMRAAEQSVWLPGHMTQYEHNAKTDEWTTSSESSITYNANGKKTTVVESSEGTYKRTQYTYDEKGRVVMVFIQQSADGKNYTDFSKEVKTYDERTGVQTSDILYKSNGSASSDAWPIAFGSEKTEIERNADGNVTSFTTSEYNNDGWYEKVYCQFEYGDKSAEGPTACTIYEYNADSGGLDVLLSFTDMVWQKSNGQILDELGDSWMDGDNVIKSAKGTYQGSEVNLTAQQYDNGGYQILLEMPGDTRVTIALEKNPTDDKGSYKSGMFFYVGVVSPETVMFSNVYDIKYNDHGDMVEKSNYMNEGLEEELVNSDKYEYKYEGEHGEKTEVLWSAYDEESKQYQPLLKNTYDSFAEYTTTGLNSVKATDSGKGVEYFNMQGVRVPDMSQKGIYIVKQGGKTMKVAKK